MTAPPLPRSDRDFPCRVDPELFFEETSAPRIDSAKALCRGCPFRQPCLEYALRHRVVGIWGATTPEQRQRIRERRRIIPAPLSFGLGPTRASAIRRMRNQNVPTPTIAERLGVTQEAVNRVLREDAQKEAS